MTSTGSGVTRAVEVVTVLTVSVVVPLGVKTVVKSRAKMTLRRRIVSGDVHGFKPLM